MFASEPRPTSEPRETRYMSDDPRDLIGSPYSIAEHVFDECDLPGCEPASVLHRMNPTTESLTIRPAVDVDIDIERMRTLLNEIIRVGGTTAITNELSPDEMREWFISGKAVVSCFVAVDSDGTIVGFQSLSKYDSLPAGWVDIATFASRSRHKSGVGSALFARTRDAASRLGFSAINATIRVVNEGGLAYYSRMGFTTYLVEDGNPQAQGRVFNRVHKRFDLATD